MFFFQKAKKEKNWVVITGAPSSGKTTILDTLSEKGYKTLSENARIYIDQQLAGGRTINEIRANEFEFQKVIAHMNIQREQALSTEELVFMERAIPDSLAYIEKLNQGVPEFLQDVLKTVSYRKVFLLEPLLFEKDYARLETKEDVMALHSALDKSYRSVGIEPILIPVMSLQARINFILESLD